MNYRHIYHAGNFADIIKHIALIAILEQIAKKDKPFAVLDGFAGTGKYDLKSEQAMKTGESDYGIKQLLEFTSKNNLLPRLIQKFLSIIKNSAVNDIYPGSPLIIQNMLSNMNRLIACELHPEDYKELKKLRFSKAAIHNLDAYTAVKAFLPFKEGRGLVFLDPPFEVKDEFDKLISAFKIIKQRAQNITVLIWYPIKNLLDVQSFYQKYQAVGFAESIKIEFELLYNNTKLDQKRSYAIDPMKKCGLLITNPPNIKDELVEVFDFLVHNIYVNQAKYNMKFI